MILVRLLTQTVLLALGQMWSNKVRTFLTTLGIIIAVVAVVITVAAMVGLKQFVLDQFATIGANKVWIFPRRPPEARERFSFRQIRLTVEQVDGLLANCPSLMRLTPIMQLNPTVQAGERVRQGVLVQGIRPEWHEIEQRFVTQGRPFMRIDEDERRQVCLVNDKGIEELGLDTDPTGDFVLIEGRRFLIVGVVETKSLSPMFGGDEALTEIYIPFATGLMMRPEPGMYVVAQTHTPEMFDDAKAEVRFFMRRVRGLEPEDPDTFGVESIEQARSQFGTIAAAMTGAVGGLVGISLLVGGIGIMNIMLVSVSERTREIGLRKAVGARPEVVLLQFLVEAVTLCLVGGGIGLGIGQTLVLAMRMSGADAVKGAEIPAWAVVLAIGFSAGTGVIFGMFPAVKAARLDPIDALRHE
ncbi:MAG: ABC transporter permease [Planctomycetota bacterium]|nr:ABC transporter permease [Planctomycetota bacterium]